MLYERRRNKINLFDNGKTNDGDSTRNSDKNKSKEKVSSLSQNSKKSFTKLLLKRPLNTEISQKQTGRQINSMRNDSIHDRIHKKDNCDELILSEELKIRSFQDLGSFQQNQKQKQISGSNTVSICSSQAPHNQPQGPHSNRKKFKLYCEVKKKKLHNKKADNQLQKNYPTSTSESFLKNSIYSRTSEQIESVQTSLKLLCQYQFFYLLELRQQFFNFKSILFFQFETVELKEKVYQKSELKNFHIQKLASSLYTNKSKDKESKSSKTKINLTQKIKQIRSKQKNQKYQPQKDNFQIFQLQLNDQHLTKKSEQSSKRGKNSLEKKQSTVNIKRSLILQKLNNQRNSKLSQTSREKDKEKDARERQIRKNLNQFKHIQNKILPQDSQIISQSVNKLSEIQEEDTISRSLKTNELNSIDHSNSKNNELHLSINSIYYPNRRTINVLQTTQLRQSSALIKQIQSSLSELQKSRQQVNIQRFQQPKTIGQMGSEISQVEQNMTTIQKIQFHIQLINTLSNFVYKSTQLEYLMEEWDELNFLIYKKFYLQRVKVLNFLKKYPIRNPFCIKRASIQTKEVLKSLKENEVEIRRIKESLQKQNTNIKKNLEVFFAQFQKQKQGQKINLFEYDNFSHWIYKEIWDQIQLFSYSQSHNQTQLEDRICKSLQAGFLISELNGNYVTPFQDAEIASHHNKRKVYIDDNLKIFQRYVLNKKK